MSRADKLAEEVGFEPTNGCPLPVFKTGAIDHSATLPGCRESAPGGGSIRRAARTGVSPTCKAGGAGGVRGRAAVRSKQPFVEIGAWKRVQQRGWRGVY